MIQLSTQALLHTLANDPAKTGETIKAAIQSGLVQENSFPFISSEPKDIAQIMTGLFNKLIAGISSKEETLKNVQQSLVFKQNSPVATELKTLAQLVAKEPALKSFVEPLNQFLTHVSQVNADELPVKMAQTGVRYEAGVKAMLFPPKLPVPLTQTLTSLQVYIPKSPLPLAVKQELIKSIELLLSPKEMPMPKVAEHAEKMVTLLSQNLRNTPSSSSFFTPLAQLTVQLETLGKKHDIVAAQSANIPHVKEEKPLAVQYTEKLKEALNVLLKEIDKRPLPLPKEVSTPREITLRHQKVEQLFQEVKTLVSVLLKEPTLVRPLPMLFSETSVPKEHPSIMKNVMTDHKRVSPIVNEITSPLPLSKTTPPSLSATMPEKGLVNVALEGAMMASLVQTSSYQPESTLNVQDQLKLVVLKLKNALELIDPKAVSLPQSLHEGKVLTKVLHQELQTFVRQASEKKPLSMPLGILEKDVKHTLLQLKEATEHVSSSRLQEINTHSTKALAQIEMHQLISYTNNSFHAYIPYLWEGMKEGTIAFKKGEDESFYCQIDLELQEYGRINVMLMLFDDHYINLSIGIETEALKEKVKEHLSLLKAALSEAGLVPLHVKMLSLPKDAVYNGDEGMSFGMNLKV